MSELTGFDVEAVLRDHRYRPDADGRGGCACGELPDNIREWTVESDHRAHVAAVLRVEIETALGDAWDEGYEAGVQDIDAAYSAERFTDTPNPYRPTLAATEGDRQ